MAGAIIVIDQPGGAGAGSPGVARNDLWQLQQVNLSCATVNATYQWDLLDVPPGSGATLTGGGTSTPHFLPDLIGTYRIQLITNGGGPGNVQILVIRVRFNSTGVIQNRGWAPPAFGEQSGESNYGGNTRGWAEELEYIFADIRTSGFAGGGGAVPATPNTLAERGTSGEGLFAWFAPSASGVAHSTLLRMSSLANGAVAARGTGNTYDVMLLGVDGGDGAVLGDATNGASATLLAQGSSIGNNFIQVHRSTGIAVFGDATNGVAITSSGGPVKLMAPRVSIGFGSTWSQFAITPRPWGVGGTPLAIDFDAFGSNPDLTLTADSTLSAPSNVIAGGRYTVTIRQDGGPYALAWDPAFSFSGTFSGVISALADAVDVFEFIGDATGALYCVGACNQTSPAGIFVRPLGGGLDDGPQLHAALVTSAATGIPVRTAGTYTILSTVVLPAHATWYMGGASFNSAVPFFDGVTDAALFCSVTNQGTPLELAANAVAGATSFTTTATTDLQVGGWLLIAHNTQNFLQILRVVSITGASNPFTITVDRPLNYLFPSGGAPDVVVYSITPAKGIQIHGEGATLTATQNSGRGIELGAAIDSVVEDINIRGPYNWGFSFDDGSYRSIVRHCSFEGDIAYSGVGFASEANEQCRFEHLYVSGVGIATGAQAGLFAYSGRYNRFVDVRVTGCTGAAGAVLDAGTSLATQGSDGCVLESCAFDRCGLGVQIGDVAMRWTLRDSSISHNTGLGVLLTTTLSGAPTSTTLDGCHVLGNGNNGILIATGYDTSIINCRVSSNAGNGLEVAAGAKGTKVIGGRWDTNVGYVLLASDDCHLVGLTGYDNGEAVTGAGSAYISVSACEIGVTSGSAAWHGFRSTASGVVMRLTDCRVVMTGASNCAAFSTSAGTMWIRQSSAVGGGSSYGLYIDGGGTIKIDESVSLSGTGTPATGTPTTTSANETSYS